MSSSGRPTKYKEEYNEQAYKLCLLGHTDAELAIFFGVSVETIAQWAWDNESFYNAITIDESDLLKHQKKIDAQKDRLEKKKAYKRKWTKEKREKNPSFKIEGAIRARLAHAVKGTVASKSIKSLPYTTVELMNHLELLFTKGMTWDNYGKWHIDHIKPCSLFDHNDRQQMLECWSLSNLQPLWAVDNLSKGNRYGSS